MCVVGYAARAVDALHQTCLRQRELESAGEKLDTAIAVLQRATLRLSLAYGRGCLHDFCWGSQKALTQIHVLYADSPSELAEETTRFSVGHEWTGL